MEYKGGTYDSTYVFSAEQQEEVKKIYQKYFPHGDIKKISSEEMKMAQLRKLDQSVTRAGSLSALLAAVCDAVIHGIGITLVQSETMFALGTVIAIIGLVLLLVSYPIYCIVVKKQRRKVQAQILKLCRELMK